MRGFPFGQRAAVPSDHNKPRASEGRWKGGSHEKLKSLSSTRSLGLLGAFLGAHVQEKQDVGSPVSHPRASAFTTHDRTGHGWHGCSCPWKSKQLPGPPLLEGFNLLLARPSRERSLREPFQGYVLAACATLQETFLLLLSYYCTTGLTRCGMLPPATEAWEASGERPPTSR